VVHGSASFRARLKHWPAVEPDSGAKLRGRTVVLRLI
jgi:hypothetical protein